MFLTYSLLEKRGIKAFLFFSAFASCVVENSSQHFSISTQTPPFHLSLFAFANLETNIPLFESDEWRGSDFNSESKNSGVYGGENDSEESISP